jgi:hypothetical protein
MCMPGAAEQIQSLVDDAAGKGAKVRRLTLRAHVMPKPMCICQPSASYNSCYSQSCRPRSSAAVPITWASLTCIALCLLPGACRWSADKPQQRAVLPTHCDHRRDTQHAHLERGGVWPSHCHRQRWLCTRSCRHMLTWICCRSSCGAEQSAPEDCNRQLVFSSTLKSLSASLQPTTTTMQWH